MVPSPVRNKYIMQLRDVNIIRLSVASEEGLCRLTLFTNDEVLAALSRMAASVGIAPAFEAVRNFAAHEQHRFSINALHAVVMGGSWVSAEHFEIQDMR